MARITQGGPAYPVTIVDYDIAPGGGNQPNLIIGRTRMFPYTTVRTGELVAGLAVLRCPAIACDLVKFKAHPGNSGYIHLGWNIGVTITDGTADTTTGFILAAGDDSGWIPITDMSLLFYIGSAAAQKFTYLAIAP